MLLKIASFQEILEEVSYLLAEEGLLLADDLNRQLKRPYIIASALTGKNVVVTLKKIISMTTAGLKANLN